MKKDEFLKNMMDQYWRLNNIYYIVDEKGLETLFEMRPAQEDFYEKIHFFNVVLKARQLGFTTEIDILGLDMAIFTSNFSVVIIAHHKVAAEDIFNNKILYAYDRLPDAIRASVRVEKRTAQEIRFSNGSSVKVSTSARSGTVQFLHVSEYGSIGAKYPKRAREIKTGSLPAVHPGGFCFIESTAEGNAGHFFDLCEQSEKDTLTGRKLQQKEFKFHFYSWYENPNYRIEDPEDVVVPSRLENYFKSLKDKYEIELTAEQKAWYVIEEKTFGEDMWREHPSTPGEAFKVSNEGAYYKKQFQKIYAEGRLCHVAQEDTSLVYTFWDLGISDSMCIWFVQFIGREYRIIDYHEGHGEGFPYYAALLMEKGYLYGQHFAPHDIAVRELGTGLSRMEQAKKLGIRFTAVPTNVDVAGGIDHVRTMLARCWFDEANCEQGIKCLENYRKEWDEKNGMWKAQPLHDWASHGSDAFRTFAVADKLKMISSAVLQVTGNRKKRKTKAKTEYDIF